jgi:putative sigma-54 modulation protein
MNLTISGHHIEVTPAIREYVVSKLSKIKRHFDHVIDVNVIVSVDKLEHKAELNLHMRGKDIHVTAIESNLYASIDSLVSKLDRQVLKHKSKIQNHSHVPTKHLELEPQEVHTPY